MAFFVVSLFGLCAGILPAVGSKRMVKQVSQFSRWLYVYVKLQQEQE